ncbi:putative ORFan [Tupanvirus deep ocean]|uniref:ORFan n=2 Tax=Tupanvirus TaxID=2094720 RepID=A0AC62A7E6_9VIRU|nr:putative ORFan [Tupanvirus deep ocean]QKU33697.1 putative ORFan [Tupanvirus deep ocean]
MPFIVITRKQFTFVVDDKKLACLLTSNVITTDIDIAVNVVGIFIQKIDDGINNFVKIVIGPNDPNNLNDTSYENQLEQFRKNMKSLDIEYTEGQVLQIFNVHQISGSHCSFRILYVALNCAGIPIRCSYMGEPVPNAIVSTFIEVPKRCILKALDVIREINTEFPDKELCINVHNFHKKCKPNDNSIEVCGCKCVEHVDLQWENKN